MAYKHAKIRETRRIAMNRDHREGAVFLGEMEEGDGSTGL